MHAWTPYYEHHVSWFSTCFMVCCHDMVSCFIIIIHVYMHRYHGYHAFMKPKLSVTEILHKFPHDCAYVVVLQHNLYLAGFCWPRSGSDILVRAMGVLAKKWKALARTKNRCKKGLPWITLHGKADSAMGMKDLKKNVPLVQTALEFAPQMMNKPRQIETEVSRLPLKPKSPKELASCMNFTNKWLNCKNIYIYILYIYACMCIYVYTIPGEGHVWENGMGGGRQAAVPGFVEHSQAG